MRFFREILIVISLLGVYCCTSTSARTTQEAEIPVTSTDELSARPVKFDLAGSEREKLIASFYGFSGSETKLVSLTPNLGEPKIHGTEKVDSETPLVIEERRPDVQSVAVKATESPDLDIERSYIVEVPILNVRESPSMNSEVIRTLKKGDRIKGLSQEGIWVRTGRGDYVSERFLTPE